MNGGPAASGGETTSQVRRWPWLVAFAVFVAGAAGPLLAAADPQATGLHPLEAVGLALVLTGCLGSAAVLLSQRANNAVAWLLPLPAMYLALGGVAAVIERLGADQLLLWARWSAQVSWAASFPPLAIFLPLLFPTGRPPSPRWRWALWVGGAAVVLLAVGNAVDPQLMNPNPNPVAVGGPLPEIVLTAGGVLLLASLVAAASSAVVRYRRARGVERQQLRWFVRAVALVAPAWIVSFALEGGPYQLVGGVMLGAAIGLLPVAVALAVLRYRLYDIDRVVSRTVAWAVLSALLAGVYASVVLFAQALVGGDVPDLVIALATLTAAALVRPLQRRVQRVVDRRFNRTRYDAEVIAGEFTQRLRDEFEPDYVAHQLAVAVGRAVGPSAMSLWAPGEVTTGEADGGLGPS